ncbi:MAG TPA: hypothetical protein VJT83_07165, partial [Chitinophagaceae bacterium]|nr:hypothetical protein [Chitinophagaceae bacterium]
MKRLSFIFALLFTCFFSKAQLCTGSLGDPVVHINFGAGQNPGTPRNAATTNYNFLANDCPNDGWYTIRNSTVTCFGNSWHSLSEDHTAGDADGYFMLVNASFQPGDFYVDTVRDLCPKTTYEFAAWVVNVLKPSACQGNGIDPNLTFTIETTTGTILNSYNSGDIAESPIPIWKQYGLFFETPANTTTIVIRLRNNAPGGCGNDLALDDITFRPCGPAVSATIGVNGDTSASICQGDTTSFLLTSAHSQGYSNPVFQWQVSGDGGVTWTDIAGANQTTYLRKTTSPGDYTYRMSIAESGNIGAKSCRIASNNIAIHVNPLPVLQMADVSNVCLGSKVVLSAIGGITYQWTGPNGFSSSLDSITFQSIQNINQGIYSLIATSGKGCSTKDSTDLRVNPVPTATLTGTDHICEGTSTILDAGGGTKYMWSPSPGLSSTTINNPSASPKDTTTYKVVVTNQFNCSDSANITVYVWKKPVANAGADLKTKEGIPVTLDGTVGGTDIEFFWSPP